MQLPWDHVGVIAHSFKIQSPASKVVASRVALPVGQATKGWSGIQ